MCWAFSSFRICWSCLGDKFTRGVASNVLSIVDFMVAMFPLSGEMPRNVVRSLICTVAFLIEHSGMWICASPDALLHAPVPAGTKRSKRLDDNLKRAVGEVIAIGEGGKTAGKVVGTLARFRRWGSNRFGVRPATNAMAGRVASYFCNIHAELHPERCTQLAIAVDGTRMGGKGVLFFSCYSPAIDKAFGAPPQVIFLICATDCSECYQHRMWVLTKLSRAILADCEGFGRVVTDCCGLSRILADCHGIWIWADCHGFLRIRSNHWHRFW